MAVSPFAEAVVKTELRSMVAVRRKAGAVLMVRVSGLRAFL